MTLDPPVEKRHSIDLAELKDHSAVATSSRNSTASSTWSPLLTPGVCTEADSFGVHESSPGVSTSGAEWFRDQAKDIDQRWLQVLEALRAVREESVIARQLWDGDQLPTRDADATQPVLPASPSGLVRAADPFQVAKNMVLMQQRARSMPVQRVRSMPEQGQAMEVDVFVTHRPSGKASTRASLSEIVRKVKQISMSLSSAAAIGNFVRTVEGGMEQELPAG